MTVTIHDPKTEEAANALVTARPPALGLETRRVFERLGLEIDVSVESDHNFYTGFSLNISGGGLFVATHLERPVGSRVEVTFRLPAEEEAIVARAEVRWTRTYDTDSPAGLGLRFLDLDDRARALIMRFIANREPLFFED